MLMPPPHQSLINQPEQRLPRAFGPTVTVQNAAPIWYDFTSQLFGSQLRVAAFIAPNQDYEVEISAMDGTILKTLPGTSSASGAFEKIWDLVPTGEVWPPAD